MRLDRRDWLGLAGALAAAIVCVRLGFWQLDRLRQRRARNAVVLAARQQPLTLRLEAACERGQEPQCGGAQNVGSGGRRGGEEADAGIGRGHG